MALKPTTTMKSFANTAEMIIENITPYNIYLKAKVSRRGPPVQVKEQKKQNIEGTKRI